jgi:hypothetical protein
MAKLNEGDVIEGIFTIALSLYIAYGRIDKSQLNRIRSEVDTKMFTTGRFKYTVVQDQQRKHPGKPADKFNVSFEMRLKPESVQGAFGKDYEVLYKSSKDIGKLDKKIDQLIKSVENTSFVRKVNDAINSFLDNSVGEVVTFNVVSDGIAGESSGGDIKGDITLDIQATKKRNTNVISSLKIPFSLKSESSTVANLAPYRGMLDIAKALGISWDAEKKYSRLSTPFVGAAEQKAKFELISKMYSDLKTQIISESNKPTFTRKSFEFLQKSIFGSDLAQVVDVRSSGVKEITIEYFNLLKTNVKLSVQSKDNNLVFVDKKTGVPIFKIRTKIRPEANEAKFYLEVGKGIYSK